MITGEAHRCAVTSSGIEWNVRMGWGGGGSGRVDGGMCETVNDGEILNVKKISALCTYAHCNICFH